MRILYPFLLKTFHSSAHLFSTSVKKKSLVILFGLLVSFSAFSQDRALDFDISGSSDYVTIPNLVPSGSYTKEAWINLKSTSGVNIIVGGYNTVFFVFPGGILWAGHNLSNGLVQDPSGALVAGVWYHVAVTYDAPTQTLSLIKNGVSVTSAGGVPNYAETVQFIGAYTNSNSAPTDFFDGRMDEVRIWNIAKTAAQISASLNCNVTGDEPGLVAYYNFNQGTAGGTNTGVTTLNDAADRCVPNNGTLVNFALSGAASNWITSTSPVSGGTCTGTFANINITGNSNCITDGDGTPSTTDFTDFNGGFTRTFTIQNTGSATLNISSIAFSGANASEFSVSTPPAASVIAGGSTTFTITFAPLSNGVKTATVTVNNDDGDETAYDYALTASVTTLPVEIKSFTVKKITTKSELNWITASENNNLGFEVYRSNDGVRWIKIGFVAGSGTTNADKSYSFTDPTPVKGVNYYQLKQIDFNNNSKLSAIRIITFASDKMLVYPVPAKDNIVIELSNGNLVGTTASIADWQGRVVQQVKITKIIQEISLVHLPAGMYILRMNDGATEKIIKQ